MAHRVARLCFALVLTGALLVVVSLAVASPAAIRASPLDTRTGEPAAPGAAIQSALPFTINLALVTGGLSNPVYLAHAGDSSGRLFVVEQAGKIRLIKNGVLQSTPYLTLTSLVQYAPGGEQGLLSVAFDPDFKTNRTFYVNYTEKTGGDTVVARYVVADPAADVASPISVTTVLYIIQPEANHNGGQLQFGPKDGYLYVGMGDGGGGGDQHGTIGNGQALNTLLGKIVRINVRSVPTYTVPASNPFTQTVGVRPEIWAYGLRNPWRFSFDSSMGDMYIGDVGQNCYEEVDYQPAGSHGGENYGWRLMEGFHAFDPNDMSNCGQPIITPVTLTLPISDYAHSLGSAVTGGYVYRGHDYPGMSGVYFYADYGSGRIWAVQQMSPGNWVGSEMLNTPYNISSFGEDQNGEVYVLSHATGQVYKIVSSGQIAPIDLTASQKYASNPTPITGSVVTYTIVVSNSGAPSTNTVHLTDTVPTGLLYKPGSLTATSGTPDASSAPMLKWSGVLSSVSRVTVTYAVTVTTASVQTITNTVFIDPGFGAPLARSATIVANPIAPIDLTASQKYASNPTPTTGSGVTYTIALSNSGAPSTNTVRLTDTLPVGLLYKPGSLTATSGTPDASSAPMLKWSGVLSSVSRVTVTYAVTVTTASVRAISNTVFIDPGFGAPLARSAMIVANPLQMYLPLLFKNY